MISFIVPTIGRASLGRTLASIELQGADELLVVGPVPPLDRRACYVPCATAHDWGATERTAGIAAATQPYLAFMDDDDVYVPGARALLESAIEQTPGRPTLFRLRYPNGAQLWTDPDLRVGNVSTQMMLIPNEPAKLGSWHSGRRESDFDFLVTSQWPSTAFAWRPEVICQRSWEASR